MGPLRLNLFVAEVIYVIRCTPIKVNLVQIESCYNELPVLKNNKILKFLTPITRILIDQTTEVSCSTVLSLTFKINNVWFKFLPNPIPAKKPVILTPDSKITWKYEPIKNLATSGIYSETEIQDL